MLNPLMLSIGAAKTLSLSIVSAGTLFGVAAAQVAAITENSPVQLVLVVASIGSIATGFYWYGRLTEKVERLKDDDAKLSDRVTQLEQEQVSPGTVEKMAADLTRVSRTVWRIAGALKLPDDRTET